MKRVQFLTAIILTVFMAKHSFVLAIEDIESPSTTTRSQAVQLHQQDTDSLSGSSFYRRIAFEHVSMITSALSILQPELRTVALCLNSITIIDQIHQICKKGKLTFLNGSSILLKAPALFSSHGHWVLSSIVGNAFSIFGTLKNRSDASLWQAAHKFVQKIHPGLSEDDHND